MAEHTATTTLEIGAVEVDVEIAFDHDPGCPAWGGSRFEPPINPPEPERLEIGEITLRARGDRDRIAGFPAGTVLPCPDWLAEVIRSTEYVREACFDALPDHSGPDPDDWRDRMIEREMMER